VASRGKEEGATFTIDMSSKIKFHHITILKHCVVTIVGRVVCGNVIQGTTRGECNTSFQAIFLNKFPIHILNLGAQIDQFDPRFDDALCELANLCLVVSCVRACLGKRGLIFLNKNEEPVCEPPLRDEHHCICLWKVTPIPFFLHLSYAKHFLSILRTNERVEKKKRRNTPRRKFGFLLQGISPQETTQRLVVMGVTFVHRDRNLRYPQGGGSGLKERKRL